MSPESGSEPEPLIVTVDPCSTFPWSAPASAVGASFTLARVTVRSAVSVAVPSLTYTLTW